MPTHAAIEHQLQRILDSSAFLNSRRLIDFLRFAVEEALRGNGERIKEYVIGVQVFGRSPSYDPRTDPVVRVEAGRLRLKLAEYYRTQGQGDPVLIDLPKGTYAPVFQTRSTKPSWGARRVRAAAFAVGVMAAFSAYYFQVQRPPGRVPGSIAVLPFVNLSANPDNQYLGDGLAEELTTALAQLDRLRVVAATSAFRFRGKGDDVRRIGQQLSAGVILEGSVSKSPGGLRIMAQLISTQNGYHLWAKAYDVEAGKVFDAEEDIVRQTARTLNIPVGAGRSLRLPKRETQDPEPHDLYLRGRYFWSKRDLPDMERAVELFKAAIQKDPNFGLAYAGLADTYVVMGGNGQKPLSEVVPRAKETLARALALDPDLAEAHTTLAMLLSPWDQTKEVEFRRATELSPGYATAHHWHGVILSAMGRFQEADAELREAQILDPLSPIITEDLAENFYYWRRYDSTIEQVRRIREMGSGLGDHVLGLAYIQKGMYAEAINVFRALPQGDEAGKNLTYLACAYAASGRREEALKLLNQASTKGYVSPFLTARVYVLLREKDTAFRWLQKAYQQTDPIMAAAIKVDPILDPIRSNRQYAELLKKVGLAD